MPCKLDLDSPSYPPTEEEYRQCGCPLCFKYLEDLEDAKQALSESEAWRQPEDLDE